MLARAVASGPGLYQYGQSSRRGLYGAEWLLPHSLRCDKLVGSTVPNDSDEIETREGGGKRLESRESDH